MKPKKISKAKLRQLGAAQNLCLYIITGVYKSTLIAVLEYKIGFPPLQMHLEKLAIAYMERIQKGLIREHIKKECNTIRATIVYQL